MCRNLVHFSSGVILRVEGVSRPHSRVQNSCFVLVFWVGRRPTGPHTHVANIWRHRGDSLCLFTSELWNPVLEKAAREKAKVDGGLAVGWRPSWSAAAKMAAVKSCDAQAEQARSPDRRRRPRTLSDALDPPGHQNKCRQARLSS